MSDREFPGHPTRAARAGARIGISCQFAALVRILSELVWFQLRNPEELSPAKMRVYLVGALVAALFCWVSVVALWFGRARVSTAVAIGSILVLLAIKVWAVRAGLL